MKKVKIICAHCGAEIKTGLSCPNGCTDPKNQKKK